MCLNFNFPSTTPSAMHLQSLSSLEGRRGKVLMMVDGQWNYPLVLWQCYVLKKSLLKQKVYLWTWIWINFCGTFFVALTKNPERERILTIISIIQEVLIIFFILLHSHNQKRISSARNKEETQFPIDEGRWMMDMMELINSYIVHCVLRRESFIYDYRHVFYGEEDVNFVRKD